MYINVKWNSKRAIQKVKIYQGHEYLFSQKSVGGARHVRPYAINTHTRSRSPETEVN